MCDSSANGGAEHQQEDWMATRGQANTKHLEPAVHGERSVCMLGRLSTVNWVDKRKKNDHINKNFSFL